MKTLLSVLLLSLSTAGFAIGGPKQDAMHSYLDYVGSQIIDPVVFVRVSEIYTGTGVVIYSGVGKNSGDVATFVVTNFHVISELISQEEGAAVYKPAKVWIYRYAEKGSLSSRGMYVANIVAFDKEADLALLQLHGNSDTLTNVAKIGRSPPRVLEQVFAVGSGLGWVPFPTLGMVSYVDEKTILASAPIILGSSGGGLFALNHDTGQHELVGVAKTISTVTINGDVKVPGFLNIGHRMVPTTVEVPVPHMGHFITMKGVCTFLTENGHAYICID